MRTDITSLSAGAIAHAVAGRRLRAADVTAAFLARVEEVNPRINAICTVNAACLDEADACDRRLERGAAPRPLEGVPFVVKDVIPTRGVRTTFGSTLFEHHVPDQDAVSVERLKAAGAVLLGKANTPEFAHNINTTNDIFGTTRNPWRSDATAGGSSGGTAAAIAARMAPIGLGTDFGGSVRIPASYCGVVGLRPAPGRVPVHPAEFAWDTLVAHVHGPMAGDVADVGRMLAALSGPDDRDPATLPAAAWDYVAAAERTDAMAGRRAAYSPDLGGLAPVDPEVAARTRAAAALFEALGCAVEEDFPDAAEVREIIPGTRAFAMIGRYADLFDANPAAFTPHLMRQLTDALRVDVRGVVRAERLRGVFWHRLRRFMERYDYILTPTTGTTAFTLDRPLPVEVAGRPLASFYDTVLPCYAFSLVGLPAISVPCGLDSGGLPVGLQIVGHRHREDQVLEAAAALQHAHPGLFAPPAVGFD